MKFHHEAYVSADPRVQPAAGTGIDRPQTIPDKVDVLIIGAGPAGMITAAQLAQFPEITTRIVDRNAGRLEVGRADGIQKRTVETFEAFGFAGRITEESSEVMETAFWKPDPDDVSRIKRVSRVPEDPNDVSEYPHLNVNQARVLDYFAEAMVNAPSRMTPDYGEKFEGLSIDETDDYPVAVTLTRTAGPHEGEQHVVRAKYAVGSDGAHSRVRRAIGCRFSGESANHAWGVMDILAVSDFPDMRLKCAIQSEENGSILLIPREGGHLFRMYVDLGDITPDNQDSIRSTTVEQTIARAQKILCPYSLDVRDVAWYSVYEVGHRICDRFDDVPLAEAGRRMPRVFIMGDAGHTHSAKAGQGMNVSMQDGFNLGWKLAHVLQGRSPERLLATYSAERQVIGQDIINFDKEWASVMAKPAEDFDDPSAMEDAYLQITEFAQGFMTQYSPSMITGAPTHQALATGYPIGKRFRSAWVTRVADANILQLGHQARADGRWRLYVFADAATADDQDSAAARLGTWFMQSPDSPVRSLTPAGADAGHWFDIKIIHQQAHVDVDLTRVAEAYMPRIGSRQLIDYDNVFAAIPEDDIFETRGIDRGGAVVVVRPDQYVAHVLPLTATEELASFLSGFTLKQD